LFFFSGCIFSRGRAEVVFVVGAHVDSQSLSRNNRFFGEFSKIARRRDLKKISLCLLGDFWKRKETRKKKTRPK